jgi:lipid-binding SYLF domain-containing protein
MLPAILSRRRLILALASPLGAIAVAPCHAADAAEAQRLVAQGAHAGLGVEGQVLDVRDSLSRSMRRRAERGRHAPARR